MRPPPSVTRRQLGPPLGLTDAQLTALAQVTPADVAAAALLWRQLAPRWAKNLLKALPSA